MRIGIDLGGTKIEAIALGDTIRRCSGGASQHQAAITNKF